MCAGRASIYDETLATHTVINVKNCNDNINMLAWV